MPIHAELIDTSLSLSQVEGLWQCVRTSQNVPDDVVSVRFIPAQEMQTLNRTYRGKDRPTNVLTFSYPPTHASLSKATEHEVVACLEVARKEAALKGVSLGDYVALLLVHAFLHVAGLDHEKSPQEAAKTSQLEKEILQHQGFKAFSLE